MIERVVKDPGVDLTGGGGSSRCKGLIANDFIDLLVRQPQGNASFVGGVRTDGDQLIEDALSSRVQLGKGQPFEIEWFALGRSGLGFRWGQEYEHRLDLGPSAQSLLRVSQEMSGTGVAFPDAG